MFRDDALDLLQKHNPYGGALVDHCSRVAKFTLEVARARSLNVDTDLVWGAAWLHDIGLLADEPKHGNYLARGLEFALRSLPSIGGWGVPKAQAFEEMMLLNHSLPATPQTAEGECMRLGVQVEHSGGWLSRGVSKKQRHSIFERHPRGDFNRVLLSFARQTFSTTSAKEIVRLFFPRPLPTHQN